MEAKIRRGGKKERLHVYWNEKTTLTPIQGLRFLRLSIPMAKEFPTQTKLLFLCPCTTPHPTPPQTHPPIYSFLCLSIKEAPLLQVKCSTHRPLPRWTFSIFLVFCKMSHALLNVGLIYVCKFDHSLVTIVFVCRSSNSDCSELFVPTNI